MKINPITISKINGQTFGYNKKYHKKVQNELSKSKNIVAKSILENEQSLLNIEDKIVKMEKESKYARGEYQDLADYLVEVKSTIAYFIELINGDLKYSDTLIQTYLKEIEKCSCQQGIAWREALCKKLNAYTIKDYFPPEPASSENEAPEATLEEKNILSVVNDTIKNQNNKKTSPLMTLYEPNQYSPSGFDDVVGSEEIKEKLRDNLIYYIQDPEQSSKDYHDYGIRAPRGFLFYGPPGCGKTFIAKALANETGMDMYMMDVSKVGSMYVNKTSNNIQEAFEFIFKAAKDSQKPIILFMDEIDALAKNRNEPVGSSGENSKATTTLLKLVEIARDYNIIVIGATNKYDLLDQAFKDRFDGQIYFPLPDKEQIKKLVHTSLMQREKGSNLASDTESIDKLAELFKGFSNRSIVIIIDEAAKIARKRSRDNITFDDIKSAIEKTELEKPNEKDYIKSSAKKRTIGF